MGKYKYTIIILAVALFLAALLSCAQQGPSGVSLLSLSGQVTASGVPVKDVEIQLAGQSSDTTRTDGEGNYTFSSLSEGFYAIKPVRKGYTFSPKDLQVELSGTALKGQDFTLAPLSAKLQASVGMLDFASVYRDSTRELSLGLTNLGNAPLTISQFIFTNPVFRTSLSGAIIQPDSLVTVKISFTPRDSADYNGILNIISDDTQQPVSQVSLVGKGIVLPPPIISADPKAINFGSVVLGSSGASNLKLSNTGGDTLRISSITASSTAFSVDVNSLVLPPKLSKTILVSFTPSSAAQVSGSLTVKNNSKDQPSFTVSLSGSGTGKKAPSIAVSPTTIDFGIVQADSVSVEQIEIRNAGTDNLIITGFVFTDTTFKIPTKGDTLIPGRINKYSISFKSKELGEHLGTLTVASNDAQNSSVTVSLKATVVPVPVPKVRINPLDLVFGTVRTGSSRTKSFWVVNSGQAQLTVSKIAATGPGFTASPSGLSVSTGDSAQVSVEFKPAQEGAFAGFVELTTNVAGSERILVGLSGKSSSQEPPGMELAPQALDFKEAFVGVTAKDSIVISNKGPGLLQISGIATSRTEFVPAVTALEVAAGGKRALVVNFKPQNLGSVAGVLSFQSNDTILAKVEIPLSGSGKEVVTPRISVLPGAVNFDTVYIDSTREYPVVVSNAGNRDLVIQRFAATSPRFGVKTLDQTPLAPGANRQLIFTFTPSDSGVFSGIVSLISNDLITDSLAVSVTGFGKRAPQPSIRLSVAQLSFGSVGVGSTSAKSLTISNKGKKTLQVQNVTTTSPIFITDVKKLEIPPDSSGLLLVAFTPQAVGTVSAELVIDSNDPLKSQLRLPLTGTGSVAQVPDIKLSKSFLDFGTVMLNAVFTDTFVISNAGSGDLQIKGISSDNTNFAVESSSAVIAAGGSMPVGVKFQPKSMGSATGRIIVASNDPDTDTVWVNVTGTGMDTTAAGPSMVLSTDTLNFGDVYVESTSSLLINVGNLGLGNLIVFSIQSSQPAFKPSLTEMTIPSAFSKQLRVSFTPEQTISYEARLVLSTNVEAHPQDTVVLIGNGISRTHYVAGQEILLPGGTFLMGKVGQAEPVRTVTVSSFYISAFEVTNAEYKDFVDQGGYDRPDLWSAQGWQWRSTSKEENFDPANPRPRYWGTGNEPWKSDPYSNRFDSPVVGVNWYEADAYARFRGRSLPTEAQWEYAARMSTGRTFPWGEMLIKNQANHGKERSPYYDDTDGYKYTAPVGSYFDGTTPEGLYDLAGNVWEWCRDWYAAYNPAQTNNPTGPSSGLERCVRGGSWNGSTEYCKAYHRNSSLPQLRYKDGGIRLVRNY